jgi:dihydrolipoamide dehydrogenase
MTTTPAPLDADIAVLGGGPGGYTAAFRAADLGRKVVLIDSGPRLGGVCLNVGCIPSKALLHTAKAITDAGALTGVRFAAPVIDLDAIRAGKDSVIGQLCQGLAALARQRGVTVLRGYGRFASPTTLQVQAADHGATEVRFRNAIIACGSAPVRMPGLPYEDPRILDSTGALELRDVPRRLLIVGGGIIGLEMAAIYHALGSHITVVERLPQLLPGADPDLVQVLARTLAARYAGIHVATEMRFVAAKADGLHVTLAATGSSTAGVFDRMLVAVGRRPNGSLIDAEKAGVRVDPRGFIAVDAQLRTNVSHIHAIGDVVGEPMLAHKATHEARVAAEVICGHAVRFDPRTIPSVAYTDPEIAWMGLTETEAKRRGTRYEKAAFPWQASGRALASGAAHGLTKILFDPGTRRLLGAGIVGTSAGDLIAEAVLALEMDAELGDLALAIHAHPTFAETLALAAELADGTITDLIAPRTRHARR